MVNTAHWRRGRKCVGWPKSGPPGSMRLLGSDRDVEDLLQVSIEVTDEQADGAVRFVEPAFERGGDRFAGVAVGPERSTGACDCARAIGIGRASARAAAAASAAAVRRNMIVPHNDQRRIRRTRERTTLFLRFPRVLRLPSAR
jgi:hypothetical protein